MSIENEHHDDNLQDIKFDYYLNEQSVLHRENDEPAYIEYYPSEYGENENGNIKEEWYFINGNIHREGDKPAFIHYYPSEHGENGNIKEEWYFINDKFYREENKPNKVEHSEDGNIITEIWMSEDGETELKRNVIDSDLEFTKPCKY